MTSDPCDKNCSLKLSFEFPPLILAISQGGDDHLHSKVYVVLIKQSDSNYLYQVT